MGQAEHELIQARLRLLSADQRRFRINAGQGWTGEIVKHSGEMLVLRNPRVFHAAPVGWSDLVGIDSVIVTPGMVGQSVAIFVAEEFKTPGLKLTVDQRRFGDMVLGLGGRFEVMR